MKKNYVWDPLIRIFHWSLVVAFIVAYVTGDEEPLVHTNAGYVILGLLVVRIIWGFVGARHARFSDFLYSPLKIATHLWALLLNKKVQHYPGHNPAAAGMVFALLFSLIGTVYSGLEMEALEGRGLLADTASLQINKINVISSAHADDRDDEDEGDYENETEDEDEFWEEVHELFANFTVFLVLLHIAGVLLSSYREKVNLIRAMFTGYK